MKHSFFHSFILSLFMSALVLGMASCGDGNEPEQMISGKFSVGKTKQVYFAQSNLWLDTETNKWSFAAHPWDIIGKDPTSIDREFFTWTEIDESSDFTNWVINTVTNGGGHTWRVLSSAEWQYLFCSRSNAEKLFVQANVNEINGIIILPDDWDLEHETVLTPNNFVWTKNNGGEYRGDDDINYCERNTITDEWEALQKKGAVFLPAAGSIEKGSIEEVGDYGFYWSSTAHSSNLAYYPFFNYYRLNPGLLEYDKTCQFSLRLVRKAE